MVKTCKRENFVKKPIHISIIFAPKKNMKKKSQKENRRLSSKGELIKKEVTKAIVDLTKMILYDIWVVIKKGILDYLWGELFIFVFQCVQLTS